MHLPVFGCRSGNGRRIVARQRELAGIAVHGCRTFRSDPHDREGRLPGPRGDGLGVDAERLCQRSDPVQWQLRRAGRESGLSIRTSDLFSWEISVVPKSINVELNRRISDDCEKWASPAGLANIHRSPARKSIQPAIRDGQTARSPCGAVARSNSIAAAICSCSPSSCANCNKDHAAKSRVAGSFDRSRRERRRSSMAAFDSGGAMASIPVGPTKKSSS